MSAKNRTITLSLEMGRRQLVALMTLGLLALTPGDLVTEQLTLTTYYPSPYGVYEELRSTQNTYLSYSGGNTCIGSNSCSTKLTVTGAARVTGNATISGSETVSGNSTVAGYTRGTGNWQDGSGRAIRDAGGGWIRTYGSTGWYNGSYGGGWYMADSSWIRTYGSKGIYHNSGIMRTDGDFQVGSGGTRFRVRTNGRVGINRNNPSYHLDVNGDARISGIVRQACRWRSYSVGSQRFCTSGWSAMSAANSGGIIRGTVPTTGWMFCCKLQQY